LPNQRTAPLASVDAKSVPYFSMALIRPIMLRNKS
jgi:hypothetical protein